MPWAPDYATVGDLKSYVAIDDAFDDLELGLAIGASSRAIDRATDRQFGILAGLGGLACGWPTSTTS
jgi:hypothetical protein